MHSDSKPSLTNTEMCRTAQLLPGNKERQDTEKLYSLTDTKLLPPKLKMILVNTEGES